MLMRQIDQLYSANFMVKLLVLISLGIPNIVIGGIIYKLASGCTWQVAFFTIYGVLYRIPGVAITRESTAIATLVLNVIFMFGVFVFAILLGMISEEIKAQIKALRAGNRPIRLRNHIVILNWNRLVLPLLQQIQIGRLNRTNLLWQQPVVILADRPIEEMQRLVAESLRGGHLTVHIRKGSPSQTKDLEKAAALQAKVVLLLSPEKASSPAAAAALTAATSAALAYNVTQPKQSLVVHNSDHSQDGQEVLLQCIRSCGKGRFANFLQLPEQSFVNRMIAQSATQPGVAKVYRELIVQEANWKHVQFFFPPAPPTYRTYRDLRRALPRHQTLCGYIDSKGRQLLNPSDDSIVGDGARLVLLQRPGSVRRSPQASPSPETVCSAAAKLAAGVPPRTLRPRHILLAGWPGEQLQDILDGFQQFMPAGSRVTAVLDKAPPGMSEWPQRSSCKVEVVVDAAPCSSAALLLGGIETADALVLGRPRGMSDMEADSAAIAALLQLQKALATCGRKSALHVMSLLSSTASRQLARQVVERMAPYTITAEFLLAEEFVAAALVQVAAEPHFAEIVAELTSSGQGQEIYMRDPEVDLGLPQGVPIRICVLWELLRGLRQTYLGYMRGSQLVMAPNGNDFYTVQPGDRVVVMAEEF